MHGRNHARGRGRDGALAYEAVRGPALMAPTTAGTWKPAKERTCRSLAHLFVAFRGKASGGIDRLRYAMPKCGPFAEPKVMVTDGAWQVDEFFLRGSGPHMCQPARHRVVEVGTASRRLRSPSPMVSRCARHRPRTTRSVALYAISPWPRGRLPAACGNLPTDTASVVALPVWNLCHGSTSDRLPSTHG
jgi:hypothetical protein